MLCELRVNNQQLFKYVIALFFLVWEIDLGTSLIQIPSYPNLAYNYVPQQRAHHPRRSHEPDAACRPHLDGGRHYSRGAAAAANKGTSPTHCDPQVRILPSTRLANIHEQPLTRAVCTCVRAVACSSATTRQRRRYANAEARMRRLIVSCRTCPRHRRRSAR